MNTLPESLTIAFLAVSIFISGLTVDFVGAQQSALKHVVSLTAEEQAWLNEHPEIVLGAPTDYPPMVIKRADGTHVGVLVDFFEEASRHLNTRIRLHIEDSWADIQKRRKTGKSTVWPLAEEIRAGKFIIMQPISCLTPTFLFLPVPKMSIN